MKEPTSRLAATSQASATVHAARLRWAMLALPLLVAISGSEAAAAISLVKNIGTNASTTIPVTVPAAGVAAGNTVIVTIALDPASGSVTYADTKGNSYSKDADVTNGTTGAAGARMVISTIFLRISCRHFA